MKYFFPIHLDGDNRGCEAIAKGTALIIGEKKENLYGLCRNTQLDTRLGIDNYYTLIPQNLSLKDRMSRRIKTLFVQSQIEKKNVDYQFRYNKFLSLIEKKDIMISTGGDMMCYDDNEVIYTNDYLHDKGIQTVLWGCSMGESNMTSRKLETLKKFTLIYARESLSYEFFKSLNLRNVLLAPDPAFILKPEKINLPIILKSGDTVGLNLSNFIIKGFSFNSAFDQDLIKFVDYVINKLDMNILLIPHVLWNMQDDRIISNLLYRKFACTNKIAILNSSQYNYCQIRYIISKCRFFLGGRTHAVISAYSQYVPTIALGYSIKSKGIAKDLNIPEEYVIDSVNYIGNNRLINCFHSLLENEDAIKNLLIRYVPCYIEKLKKFPDQIKSQLDL